MLQSPITWAIIFLGIVFAIAIGSNLGGDHEHLRGPVVAPFELVDIEGTRADNKDFAGGLTLLYFGFTFCPDICPTSLRNIGDALALLSSEEQQHIRIWFVTVDPERDTTAVLREYVELIDPRIRALSGNDGQLRSAMDAFGIVADRVEPAAADRDYYLFNHTASTMVVDAQGSLVERIPQGSTAEDYARSIRRHLR